MEEEWHRAVTIDGKTVELTFFRRPFREGLEVEANVDGEILHFAELGYGEEAVIERVAALIKERGFKG